MPRLDYTSDLRRLAGQANSATPLVANLGNVQTVGQGLDHMNVTPWSLDADHVFDEGGVADELREVQTAYAQTTAHAGPSGTPQTILTLTVDCIAGVSGIYIYAMCDTAATAAADTHEIILRVDAAVVRTVRMGEGGIIGQGTVYAFQATAGSHTIDLRVSITTAAGFPINVDRAQLAVFVVNR